jgi:hypothetical protein
VTGVIQEPLSDPQGPGGQPGAVREVPVTPAYLHSLLAQARRRALSGRRGQRWRAVFMNAHAITGRGPGRWVRLSHSRPVRQRHRGPEWERLVPVTGTESAVVRGPIPPAPVAAPARCMRGPFMKNAR